jgi:hypothetical protein
MKKTEQLCRPERPEPQRLAEQAYTLIFNFHLGGPSVPPRGGRRGRRAGRRRRNVTAGP